MVLTCLSQNPVFKCPKYRDSEKNLIATDHIQFCSSDQITSFLEICESRTNIWKKLAGLNIKKKHYDISKNIKKINICGIAVR